MSLGDEREMWDRLSALLRMLSDGRWHDTVALSQSTGLPENLTLDLVEFLSRFNLVEFDRRLKKVRAVEEFADLLKRGV